jgi:hypothetical protein
MHIPIFSQGKGYFSGSFSGTFPRNFQKGGILTKRNSTSGDIFLKGIFGKGIKLSFPR